MGRIKKKRCSKCGELKPLSEYYRKADTKDGYTGCCKACIAQQRAERYQAGHKRLCEIPGCDKNQWRGRMCFRHYQMWRRGEIKHPDFGEYHFETEQERIEVVNHRMKPADDEAYWTPPDGMKQGRCYKCGYEGKINMSGLCKKCKYQLEIEAAGSMSFYENTANIRASEMSLIPIFGGQSCNI